MKTPLLHSLAVGSLAFSLSTASAADNELFDDRYYIAPMASLAGNRGNPSSGDGFGGAMAIGKSVMPHLGVEILGDYLHYSGKTVTMPTTGLLCGLLVQCPDQVGQAPSQNIYGGGIGVNYYLSPNNAGLFIHANAEGGDRFVYNAGLGFDQPFFNRAVYLRAELLYHKEQSYSAGPLFHLGVRLPIGGVHEAAQAAPAPPVEVVPVEQPAPEPAPAAESAPATCQPPTPGQPIGLEGCKVGDTIVLRGVNFEFNKATLTVNAKTLLDQVADALLARKDIKVEVDGHTDGKGSVPYNQKLSEARAASVMKYLASRGIDPARMTSKGFGKSIPIADNSTDEGRELNRRVELKVTDSGSSAAPLSERPSTPEASSAPMGEAASAPSDGAQPLSGEAAEAAAPAAAEPVPVGEPVPAPASAPTKRHAGRYHKRAAPTAETPTPSEPAPTPSEPAPAQVPQDAGPAARPAPNEPASTDQPAPPPASVPDAASSEVAPAPTEPAPAPSEPVTAQAPQDSGPIPSVSPSESAAPDQSAPGSAPSADASAPTEPAPAPPSESGPPKAP